MWRVFPILVMTEERAMVVYWRLLETPSSPMSEIEDIP